MSGSQIGGVVGGVVGFAVGGAAGAQWGYAIGSAVGGYVDPMKTQGPRLTDAQSQTSTVGGVIPFGYGTYTCAGNIIWIDRLIEHKKTERVGKGGGQKNTTYTYTRSYAIGVCETITGYIWIKKNGKLVYAADPAALGAAMGWTAKEISDLTAASAKFLQMATLYYGTSSQMPDSTIVAVEGAGNVSPFRDLAYIVLENEDLTATQGAVSQYEFCVAATPPDAYITSRPYPVDMQVEAVESGGSVVSGAMKRLLLEMDVEGVESGGEALGGEMRLLFKEYGLTEAVESGGTAIEGRLWEPLKTYNAGVEAVESGGSVVSGSMRIALRATTMSTEAVESGGSVVSGNLFT